MSLADQCDKYQPMMRFMSSTLKPQPLHCLQNPTLHGVCGVLQLRELTMRLAFLISTNNETLLSDSLNEKVDEYSSMVQLLHTAADYKLLALGLLNFDTLEYGTPPGERVWLLRVSAQRARG